MKLVEKVDAFSEMWVQTDRDVGTRGVQRMRLQNMMMLSSS